MATMPRPPLPMPPGGPGGPGGPPGPPGGPPGMPGPGGLPGPMLQQAMAGLAGGMPGGDPSSALRSLQATPPPDNFEVAMRRGQEIISFAMSLIYQRSPEVAKEVASALSNLKQAMAKFEALPRQALQGPPAGLPMAGMMMGGPPANVPETPGPPTM
jgi:hypothetical protein